MPLDVKAPRQETTQQCTFIRYRVRFSSAFLGAGLLLGTMPLDSIITRVVVNVRTPFNAGTTNTLTVGTTFANANELVAAGDASATATGYTEVNRGRGSALTQTPSPLTMFQGTTTDQTQGGVGVWAKFAQAGTAATAGEADIIVEFVQPNTDA